MQKFRTFGKRVLPHRIKHVIRSAAFEALGLEWQLPSSLTIRISSQSDWIIYNEIFVSGDYDPAILMALGGAKCRGEFHILDLGANVGFFTLRCIDIVRRQQLEGLSLHVTAIEGNPNTYRELQLRLCSHDNLPVLEVINGLVGDRIGSAAITDFEIGGNNRVGGDRSTKHFMVDYVDLDQVVGPRRIDLLKCDIEGAELLFLKNYPKLLQQTDVSVFEIHRDLCDEKECIALLRKAGFVNQLVLMQKGPLTLMHFWR